MTMKFKFKRANDKKPPEDIHRPLVPVILKNGDVEFPTTALLDSGADFSIVPKGIAQILKLSTDGKKVKIEGIGGSELAIKAKVNVIIGNISEKYEIELDAAIVTANVPVALGIKDFFYKFDITFEGKKRRVTLKKI